MIKAIISQERNLIGSLIKYLYVKFHRNVLIGQIIHVSHRGTMESDTSANFYELISKRVKNFFRRMRWLSNLKEMILVCNTTDGH